MGVINVLWGGGGGQVGRVEFVGLGKTNTRPDGHVSGRERERDKR